jgi:hypothetical protein
MPRRGACSRPSLAVEHHSRTRAPRESSDLRLQTAELLCKQNGVMPSSCSSPPEQSAVPSMPRLESPRKALQVRNGLCFPSAATPSTADVAAPDAAAVSLTVEPTPSASPAAAPGRADAAAPVAAAVSLTGESTSSVLPGAAPGEAGDVAAAGSIEGHDAAASKQPQIRMFRKTFSSAETLDAVFEEIREQEESDSETKSKLAMLVKKILNVGFQVRSQEPTTHGTGVNQPVFGVRGASLSARWHNATGRR